MTTSPTNSSIGETQPPVRAYASHKPKWQRFQNRMTSASTSGAAGKNGTNKDNKENKKNGTSTTKSASTSSVKSSENEIIPYQRQYSHVYSYRLSALKDKCWNQLKKLPNNIEGNGKATDMNTTSSKNVDRILELQENRLSNVVGTLIVERLNSNSDDNYYQDGAAGEDRQLHPESICRSGDQLFLEDESGRVAIRFVDTANGDDDDDDDDGEHSSPSYVYQYCTGTVVGVRGLVDEKGMMHVQYIVNPALVAPPAVCSENGNDNKNALSGSEPSNLAPHLLLVSSLLCGDPDVSSLPREMLVSYLQGHFDPDSAARVARIVVAGSGPGAVEPTMGLRELDLWGLQVTRTASIPLDILPSATDPTSRNWPQRPFHSSLLPHTLRDTTGSAASMAHMTPNPYEAMHGNQLVLGTDGLNVRDLQKHILKPQPLPSDDDNDGQKKEDDEDDNNNSTSSSPQLLTELEALEQTLRWSHICPTGPSSSSLGMVPSGDPMVLNRATPNLYFCGNCEEGFATKLLTYDDDDADTTGSDGDDASESEKPKTRLVCIPKFSETGEAVLVNLQTLDVEVLRFKTNENDNNDVNDDDERKK